VTGVERGERAYKDVEGMNRVPKSRPVSGFGPDGEVVGSGRTCAAGFPGPLQKVEKEVIVST
jgi:hypothetical protein